MISVELERLTHLLNDMHDPSLLMPENSTDFDLVLLICDLVTLIRPKISPTIGLEVDAEQSFEVHLPESLLRQALLNLLLNAVQAVDRKATAGHICVKVFQAELGLMIQIFDDGAGFSATRLKQEGSLFPLNLEENTGSGITMTRQFIKSMGGNLKLSNRQLHGACVSILLPTSCLVENQS